MIKKIILIMVILLLCVVPVALADAAMPLPDKERINFTCKVKSTEVKIGEPFDFTIVITNNTSKEVKLLSFTQIFSESYYDDSIDIGKIVIEPYKTITLDISYKVPENINWYENDGQYYVDFFPELNYEAKELLDGADKPEWYNEEYDFWEYYQQNNKSVPYKIANLYDGSEYASISVIDKKSILGFNGAYSDVRSRITNYFKIENSTNETLTDICVYKNTYDSLDNVKLDAGQSYTFTQDHIFYMREDEIPKSLDIAYKLLFMLDGEYYCTYTTRQYKTKIYRMPDLKVIKTLNESSSQYTYTVVNSSYKDYKNFVIYYGERNNKYPFYELNISKWENNQLSGEFRAGEEWIIPKTYTDVIDNHNQIITHTFVSGLLMEGVFYCDYFSPDCSNIIENNGNKIVYDYNGKYSDEDIWDMYGILNDIDLTSPTPTPTAEPAPTVKPTPEIAAKIVLTPTAIPTSAPLTVTETGSFYIPPYIYIAFALSVLATVSILVIKLRNSKKQSNKAGENDDAI